MDFPAEMRQIASFRISLLEAASRVCKSGSLRRRTGDQDTALPDARGQNLLRISSVTGGSSASRDQLRDRVDRFQIHAPF
jgi:hypothetical protein